MLLQDEVKVRAVVEDFRSAPISDAERALFTYLEKLNAEPGAVEKADVDAVVAAGWSEEAVYDALTVCALFNFYNRWIDGSGVSDMSEEEYRRSGARMATGGYVTPKKPDGG